MQIYCSIVLSTCNVWCCCLQVLWLSLNCATAEIFCTFNDVLSPQNYHSTTTSATVDAAATTTTTTDCVFGWACGNGLRGIRPFICHSLYPVVVIAENQNDVVKQLIVINTSN